MEICYRITKLDNSILTIMGKEGWILSCINNDMMYFYKEIKEVKESKKSTELVLNKSLIDLIKEEMNIENFLQYGDEEYLKKVMNDFIIYWTAKNSGGKKELRQMQKVFDVNRRYRTFLERDKKNYKKEIGITSI